MDTLRLGLGLGLERKRKRFVDAFGISR